MALQVFPGVRGIPFPKRSGTPAASAAEPTIPVGTLTATGTAHNGPTRYVGLKVTSQTASGTIQVYNGIASTGGWELIHEVTSPVVGTWYYPDGVDVSDTSTYLNIQNAYVVVGGTQTVTFACDDFYNSPYVEATEGAELTRLTANYTAGTLWWKAKGAAAGDGTGSSEANAINGSAALKTKLASGVADFTRIRFSYADGACTIATEGADWPCTASESTALSSSSFNSTSATTPSGMIFGTNQISTSTATNMWFDFGDGSTTAVDWSGGTSTTNRVYAAIRFQGEGIVVTGLKVVAPNYSHLINPSTGATRIAGVGSTADGLGNSQADTRSYENNGIIIIGNGNHLHNCHITSDKTWSRYGIVIAPSEEGVSNAAPGLRGSVSFCTVSGCLSGLSARPFGATGWDLEVPTGLDLHHNTFTAPGFGHNTTFLNLSGASHAGNASGHGNGMGHEGKFWGGTVVWANEVSGYYQDGVATMDTIAVIADNYIHDMSATTYTEWYWTGSAWSTRTYSPSDEGHAIKTGLANKDRISPSTWLGTDGVAPTASDSFLVDEMRPIVVRNIIHNVNGSGITTNESNGLFIGYNEIYNTSGPGILLHGRSITGSTPTRQGNHYLVGNFIQQPSTGDTWCIRIEANTSNTKRIWMYNNILWCNYPTTSTQFEMFVASSTTFVESRNNVLVAGRVSGTYSNANDLTDAGSITAAQAYVKSVGGVRTNAGLPVGNALRTAGTPIPQTGARTFGCYLDFRGSALHASTPCVGPCNAP